MHGGQHRSGRGKVGIGRGQVEIRRERFLDELIEPRVVVQAPPRIGRRCRRFGRRIRAKRSGASASLRQRGCVIVRPDAAGRHRRGEPCRSTSAARARSIHGGFDSRTGKSGEGGRGALGGGASEYHDQQRHRGEERRPRRSRPSRPVWLPPMRTTLASTSSPRCTAPTGSMTRVVTAP